MPPRSVPWFDRAVTILLLTGPPGAGKSTVARLLAGGWDKALHVHTDDFYAWIASGYVAPWLPESQEQNEVVTNAIAGVADRFAAAGYAVVVDGIVGPWFLGPWRALDRPVAYAVLRPTLAVTEARAAARADHPLQDLDVVTQMHAAFADLGDLEPHVIDSTDLTPEATAASVRQRLDAGELRLT